MKELTQEQYIAIGRESHIAGVVSGLREDIRSAVDEFSFQIGCGRLSNIDEASESLVRATELLRELKVALIERNAARGIHEDCLIDKEGK